MALRVTFNAAVFAVAFRLEVFGPNFVTTLSALVAIGLLAIPGTVVAIAMYYLARSAGARARHMVGITYHGGKSAWWTQPFYLAVWVIGWALWIAFVLTLAKIDRTNEGIDCVVDMAPTGMTSASFCSSEWRSKIHTAARSRCKGVRMRDLDEGGWVQLTLVYHDPMATMHLGVPPVLKLATADITKPVEIGMDERGKPVKVPLWKNNILLAGQLDHGKSTTMAGMIAYAVLDPRFRNFGIDPKRIELAPWRPAFDQVVTELDEAAVLVQWFRELCDTMTEQVVRADVTQHKPTLDSPGHILWIDEFSLLDGETQALLFQVMQLGRACSISACAAMPRPSATQINTDTRSLFGSRIAHRTVDTQESEIVLGKGSADRGWDASRLTRKGEFLIANNNASPLRCLAYNLERKDRHIIAARGAYEDLSVQESESGQSASVEQVGSIGGDAIPVGADWQPPSVPFVPYLVPDKPPAGKQARVRQVLEQHPDGLTFGELIDKARVARDTVDKATKAGEGVWCRKELGRWVPLAQSQDVA
jgi:S-DNA-T family DNA segregation ATPase FtsK/SpoIIIE